MHLFHFNEVGSLLEIERFRLKVVLEKNAARFLSNFMKNMFVQSLVKINDSIQNIELSFCSIVVSSIELLLQKNRLKNLVLCAT